MTGYAVTALALLALCAALVLAALYIGHAVASSLVLP